MKTKYDWSNISKEVNVITTNKLGYKEYWCMWNNRLPRIGLTRFYDQYNGRCVELIKNSEFKGDWKDSLEERPNE